MQMEGNGLEHFYTFSGSGQLMDEFAVKRFVGNM